MTNNAQSIYKEATDLENNSRIVKTAHFNAAHRKQKMHRTLGLLVIIINIVIFSPLLDLCIPKYSTIGVKILAIVGASLAGVQTLFNFQKDVEMHLIAGNIYVNIYHKIGTLIAKSKDNIVDMNTFVNEFETLQKEYLEANSAYKSCIPSNGDYQQANKLIKKRS